MTPSAQLAVVTGASSGIGFHLARQFALHGFDLVIAAENDDGIHRAAAEIEAEAKTRVTAVTVDLSHPEGVEKLWSQIQALGRPVEALALNAGIGVWGDFARQTELADELTLLRLNVISPVHLAKRVVKSMVENKRGKILFTSSIAGTMPAPLLAAYGASKAFLISFSEALRNELSDVGITVTALLPGATDTPFFERAGMQNTKVGQEEKDDPEEVARQGFEALMEGKDKVVAGAFKNKVLAAATRAMPDPVKAKLHRTSTELRAAAAVPRLATSTNRGQQRQRPSPAGRSPSGRWPRPPAAR
jgi:short-subunit dehydrogenase